MYIDILIFAIIAGILIYRLNAVLGTRDGDAPPEPNPFASPEEKKGVLRPVAVPKTQAQPKAFQQITDIANLVDSAANKDGRIESGLHDIAEADAGFSLKDFMAGARYAFTAIVNAYNEGDRDTLRMLLSPKLFADFDAGIRAREEKGHTAETQIHRIKSIRVVEAHLGGTMAYITVDYDVEQTAVIRDRSGAVVEGQPDRVSNVEDIWTFTRDVRATDPNWVLIETRAAEK